VKNRVNYHMVYNFSSFRPHLMRCCSKKKGDGVQAHCLDSWLMRHTNLDTKSLFFVILTFILYRYESSVKFNSKQIELQESLLLLNGVKNPVIPVRKKLCLPSALTILLKFSSFFLPQRRTKWGLNKHFGYKPIHRLRFQITHITGKACCPSVECNYNRMPRILKLISVRHLCDVLLVTRQLLIPRKYHIMFSTLKEGSHQL